MAKGSRYRVPLRRRRERKTDYQARKAMVVSRKPRLVARSSLKNTVAQIIVAKPTGDFVLASAHSKELVKKYGWKAATGNVPAAYLTGLLCGLKAKANGVPEAILDIGLVSPTKGSKVFATLSGVLDAGVAVPHDAEKLVKKRADAEHIVKYARSLGSAEEYAPKFSAVLARGLPPEKIGEHFDEVKVAVFKAFGVVWKPEVRAKPEPVAKPAKAEKAEKVEVKAKAVAKKAEVKPAAVKVEAKPVAVESAEPKKVEAEPVVAKSVAKKAKAKPAAAKAAEAKLATVKAAEPEKVEAAPAAVKTEAKKAERKKAAKAEAKPAAAKPKAKPKAKVAKVKSDAKTGGKKE